MVEFLGCKAVVLHVIVALVEDDVVALSNDVDVAILGADGAVALVDRGVFEAASEDFIFDRSTVATSFVPDLLRSWCSFSHDCTECV